MPPSQGPGQPIGFLATRIPLDMVKGSLPVRRRSLDSIEEAGVVRTLASREAGTGGAWGIRLHSQWMGEN